MSLIDVERAAVKSCFDPEPDEEVLAVLGDRRIWLVYREMVRQRLRGELSHALKRTLAAAGEAAVDRAFARHLEQAPPRVRFFHGIVGAFAESAAGSFAADPEVPDHVVDLLRYEAALWKVGDMDDRLEGRPVEFDFERRPMLAPALELLQVGHAVHRRGEEHEHGEYFLCLYRPAEEKKARTWTLSPVMFDLMQRWQATDETVSEAVRQVATRRKVAVDGAFLEGLCGVLADFLDRGMLLGSR